jgi:hypothetical protein
MTFGFDMKPGFHSALKVGNVSKSLIINVDELHGHRIAEVGERRCPAGLEPTDAAMGYGREKRLFNPKDVDHHFNATGHRLAARLLVKHLSRTLWANEN